jgi:hypothetical protein
MPHPRTVSLLLALSAGLGACGTPKVRWTPEEVDRQLDRIETNVPNCQVVERDAPSSARVIPGLLRADGSCGGTLLGTSEHDNGVTDFEVVFSSYCVETDEGQVTLDGALRAREIGTPSDDGPIIDSLESETDGPITATHEDGSVTELELRGGKVEYGKPATWAPEAPDEANPDILTAKDGTITFPDGSVSYIRDVEVVRVGDTAATLEITSGTIGIEGEGESDLRTVEGDPLVFDVLGLGFTGGAGELQGKGDTNLVVRPNPEMPGRFDLELDGAPFERSMDCGAGLAPAMEIGFAVFLELPLY